MTTAPTDSPATADRHANKPRKIAVIINPIAGGYRTDPEQNARLAVDVLERAGVASEVFVTEHAGHASDLTRGAMARGADVVAAWGGDGTINEVGSVLAFSDTALAIVPSGSGNGLARELGVSRRPVQALRDIVNGDSRRIDVGELGGRLFLNVAGAGFDAHIAREFAACRRRGFARYAWLTATHLRRFRPIAYTIATPQGRRTFDALFVCLANSRQFGNGAIIAPDARLDDGVLNMVVVGSRPAWRVMLAAVSLFRGRVADVPDVWSFPVTETEISADGPILHHVDGEPVEGDRVLQARTHAGGLLVRLPRRTTTR